MRKGSSIHKDGLEGKVDMRLPQWLRLALLTEAEKRCLGLSTFMRNVLEEYIRPGSIRF